MSKVSPILLHFYKFYDGYKINKHDLIWENALFLQVLCKDIFTLGYLQFIDQIYSILYRIVDTGGTISTTFLPQFLEVVLIGSIFFCRGNLHSTKKILENFRKFQKILRNPRKLGTIYGNVVNQDRANRLYSNKQQTLFPNFRKLLQKNYFRKMFGYSLFAY